MPLLMASLRSRGAAEAARDACEHPRDGSPRDGTEVGTRFFECVRSVWVPRTRTWAAVNVVCGIVAYGLCATFGSAVLFVAGAGMSAYAVLAGLRTLEERSLLLSTEVIQDRSACPLGPLCVPASALAAILCCLHALVQLWMPRVLY